MDIFQYGLSRRTLLRGAGAGVGLLGLTAVTPTLFPARASAAVPTPGIIPCPAWGARAPRPLRVLACNPNKIIVHHTASANSDDHSVGHAHALARSIQNFHMDDRGWPDSGQHFTVSRGGHILEGRHHSLPTLQAGSQMVEGTHCPDQNDQAIGIENEGTYIDAVPPASLYGGLVALCAYICQQYGIPATQIFGHRDFSATQCPGDRFYAMLPQLRSAVAARLAGGSPDEIGVYRPEDGTFYLRNGATAQFGIPGDIPVTGDWDGDGVDTLGVYRPRDLTFYLRNSNTSGAADGAFTFGAPGDIPLVGDWNGAGYDTIGLYRPSNQTFHLKYMNDNNGRADLVFAFGNPGDIPVAGDWDGDGIDTVGLYRPSNQTFYLKNSNASGNADGAFVLGDPGDIPITGNWDGDPYDTIGVYRPSNRTFYLKNVNQSSGEADVVVQYGETGDVPLSGRRPARGRPRGIFS